QRPEFHKALGVDPDWYAHSVFEKTSEISKQVFPITLDIDHPRWLPTLRRLQKANADLAAAEKKTGLARLMGKVSGSARAALAFASLYTIPAVRHDVPAQTRLEPAY
ncbi:MAG: magnesium-protoporphyrin IX monomethyl ester (oxidative) cyclase, partial [Pseudomonadota bacterium]